MKINLKSPETLVRKDNEGKIRKINHLKKPVRSENEKSKNPKQLSVEYVNAISSYIDTERQIENIEKQPAVNLDQDELQINFDQEKAKENFSLISFYQTYFGIRMWGFSFSIRIDSKTMGVLNFLSSISYDTVKIDKPTENDISNYSEITTKKLARLLNFPIESVTKINLSEKLYILNYTQNNRLGESLKETSFKSFKKNIKDLPSVSIKDKSYRIVREVLFSSIIEDMGLMHWRCFLDIQTGEVLFLMPFTSSITGLVFEDDPITMGENVDINDSNNILDPIRTAITLQNLNSPDGGIQKLSGDNAKIVNQQDDPNDPVQSPPPENPPVGPTGNNFNYDVRTPDFAAVNAYYIVDRILELIRELNVDQSTFNAQFPNTTFPLSIDHRGLNDAVNAMAPGGPSGDSAAGIRFGRLSFEGIYLGISTSFRIALHEFGHILLYDHAETYHFNFAHSYGDSLAAIFNDPITQASDRFDTFPWINSSYIDKIPRRHDRQISNGWAWHGTYDDYSYNSEQILSTSLFRAYRSIGGDSETLSKRILSSRLMVLLMLKAVREITPESNPYSAEDFVDLMIEADTYINPPHSVDGVSLGVAHKAIRWAFEKQGVYQQPPTGNQEGPPPAVDVYIDDGRDGEYPFIYYSWHTTDIINRHNADGTFEHQIPILDTTNYVYVKIQNRGTTAANNIVVKGYHCPPGGGGAWPQGWVPMQTAELDLPGSLNPEGTTLAGPFEWIPTIQGHECLLMTVAATGYQANTELVNSNAPNWLIINNDNNLAQRNVAPAPTEDGGLHLVEAFNSYQFYVRNPYPKPISVKLTTELPPLLKDRDWKLEFDVGATVKLDSMDQEGKLVKMKVTAGSPFSRKDVLNTNKRDIEVLMTAEKGGIIGGMTYRLDPDLKEYNERKKQS